MRLAVLGSGMVGQAIATKLASLGHEVMMGSRQAGSERAAAWASATEGKTSEGSFADAAAFAEMSETYWGTNDFFPFVRAELAEYDPQTYAMVKKMWESPSR